MEYGATVGRPVWRSGRRPGIAAHEKTQSVCTLVGIVRFFVRVVSQSALFREGVCTECAFS